MGGGRVLEVDCDCCSSRGVYGNESRDMELDGDMETN